MCVYLMSAVAVQMEIEEGANSTVTDIINSLLGEEELGEELGKLQGELESFKVERDHLKGDCSQLREAMDRYRNESEQLGGQLGALQQQMQQLSADNESLRLQAHQEGTVDQQLRQWQEAYEGVRAELGTAEAEKLQALQSLHQREMR